MQKIIIFVLLKAGLFPNKINIIKSLYLAINLSLIQADHEKENSYEKYIFKYNKEKFILVVPPTPPPPPPMDYCIGYCGVLVG